MAMAPAEPVEGMLAVFHVSGLLLPLYMVAWPSPIMGIMWLALP